MDLSTRYLGLTLPHPLLAGASPLAEDLDAARRLEDAGVAAIVMNSLFEEQVVTERIATLESLEAGSESFGEARTYLPEGAVPPLGPEPYLERLRRLKGALSVPVIASLNGCTPGGWLSYARLLEQAGADAVELNVYYLAADPEEGASALEDRTLEMVREVRSSVRIPLAVKLSPFYTALPHLAQRLAAAGADGLVLFNRFYQPDIDVEELEMQRSLRLSDPSELLLRLHWIGILAGRVSASLAVTGGVHAALDAVKAVMAGADAVQMVSALLGRGPGHLRTVLHDLRLWLEEHEYESLAQMRGSMSLLRCPDPQAYERANYMTILRSWRG